MSSSTHPCSRTLSIKKGQGKDADSARASTTDAQASVMKMGDGGFRPAYNIQYGTDTDSQIIVGAKVVSSGSDQGQMAPMVEQVTERCGHTPEQWLVDGGYPAHEQIDAVAERTAVLAPVPQSKDKQVDPHQPKAGDSQAVAEWRLAVERARYEAQRAERRYRAVDAENRLVARGLEAEWDQRLSELDQAQAELARRSQLCPRTLSPEDIQRIRALGADLFTQSS